jgi:multidrug efflux pump subunit AcrA (membrane-fusion protein)
MNGTYKKYAALAGKLTLFAASLLICACSGGDKAAGGEEEAAVKSQTPVTITAVSSGALADSISLNATSQFMQKSYVKANAIGYIQQVNIKPGQYVNKGQLLFTIKTKEAQSIGNAINILDTTFKFSGVNRIKASSSGYVTQLMHQTGDYVQDGDQLAIISDKGSFAFLLQLPYELRGVLARNQQLVLTLPDGQRLNGKVSATMPTVDSLSQTQGIVIKVNSAQPLPENLIAKARLIRYAKSNAVTLPKSSVLANETQTEFWVMKLTNDTTAIKIPVKKGLETEDKIEILSPTFAPADRIVVTGNYGLADTAKVKIVKP